MSNVDNLVHLPSAQVQTGFVLGTVYQNIRGYPIYVAIRFKSSVVGDNEVVVYSDSIAVPAAVVGIYRYAVVANLAETTVTFIVLPRYYYTASVTVGSMEIIGWTEWR